VERKRTILTGGGIAVLVGLVAALAWFGPLGPTGNDGTSPRLEEGDPTFDAATAFAEAWVAGTLGDVAATEESGAIADRSLFVSAGLGEGIGSGPTKVSVTALTEVFDEDKADAPARVKAGLEVTWTFGTDRVWTYDTAVELVEDVAVEGADPVWLVDWQPTVVHPTVVGSGHRLATVRAAAKRGEILGLDGRPIVGLRPVVIVGIQPSAVADRAGLVGQVAGVVGVDAEALEGRAAAAAEGAVVSVITLRREAFDPIAASLEDVPGVVLQETEIPLAPSRDFARALLGTTGPATEAQVATSQGRLQLGDVTGSSGLQAAQDQVLAGQPALSVRLDRSGTGEPAVVLEDFSAVEGTSLTVTLDARVQTAADEVLRSAAKPAALVAIRASTGDVLAVANGPEGADGFNRAMIGTYPPGSTFKIASALTFLQNGLTPDTIVACPATIVVGKEFRNAENAALGDVAFRKNFADSCNTAFVGQSRSVSSEQMAEVARGLGYRELDLGVPVYGGSVPVTESETEHAAGSLGQGKVQASPFAVALASASVAAGRSVQPRLLVNPASPEPKLGEPLPADAVAALRGLMREAVTNGTGSAVLGVAGGDVFGKTGTAEYGTEVPPRTHAWFTGYQGDVAFAVLVEDGGFGGQVAAPLAARFLEALTE